MSSANYSHCIPFLPVKDLRETIKYYKENLGFTEEWLWGDPPSDAGVSRDGLNLLFVENPEHLAMINTEKHRMEICLFVSNVDVIYHEIRSKNVIILSELKNEPWQVREFSILDCNGYKLRIGEGIESEPLDTHIHKLQ